MPPGSREPKLPAAPSLLAANTRAPSALPLEPVARLRALWGRGWFWPLLPLAYLLLLVALHGEVHAEHVGLALVALTLGLAGRRLAALYRELVPFVLMALAYDCVRYARTVFIVPGRVLGCELRGFDRRLISIGGVTLPEWCARHHAVWADLLAAVPYAAFLYVALGFALVLWFRDRPRMRHFLWAFALANGLAFATWLFIPAAPPWYVAAHGCAVDVMAAPSAAGLTRVDALLGTRYFSAFYAQSANVFGAMPSMHSAYPMLGLLTSWRASKAGARTLHVLYTAWMAAAAVYLGHHWVIDVLAGWATAAAGVGLTGLALGALYERHRSEARRQHQPRRS